MQIVYKSFRFDDSASLLRIAGDGVSFICTGNMYESQIKTVGAGKISLFNTASLYEKIQKVFFENALNEMDFPKQSEGTLLRIISTCKNNEIEQSKYYFAENSMTKEEQDCFFEIDELFLELIRKDMMMGVECTMQSSPSCVFGDQYCPQFTITNPFDVPVHLKQVQFSDFFLCINSIDSYDSYEFYPESVDIKEVSLGELICAQFAIDSNLIPPGQYTVRGHVTLYPEFSNLKNQFDYWENLTNRFSYGIAEKPFTILSRP